MRIKIFSALFFLILIGANGYGQEEANKINRNLARKATLAENNLNLTDQQSINILNCTGGQILVNGQCQCKPNFYWNERLKQCRPVRTCPPGNHFDMEKDDCCSVSGSATRPLDSLEKKTLVSGNAAMPPDPLEKNR